MTRLYIKHPEVMRQIPGLTVTRAKKSTKIKYLSDEMYYNFSQKSPKITNI